MSARRPKAPWLTLVAVLVIGTAVAAAADAEVVFKAPPGVNLDGELAGSERFVVGGVAQECDKTRFFRELFFSSEKALELKPIHEECTAKTLTGLKSKFVLGGCTYPLHDFRKVGNGERWTASVDLKCPFEYSLEWNVYESEEQYREGTFLCATHAPPQTEIGTAELSNVGDSPNRVTIHWDLSGIEYRVYGSHLTCGPTFGKASYKGKTTITAENYADESALDFSIGER